METPTLTDADRKRLQEMGRRGAAATQAKAVKQAIADGISAVEDEELLANFDLEGLAALYPGRARAIKALYNDLSSKNEKIRQVAYMKLLEYTDGRPGQRDDDNEPHEIVFRTEALPVDGEIRHEAEAKPPLAFEL